MKALDNLIQKLKLPSEAIVYRKNCPGWDAKAADFPVEIQKNLQIISPDAVYYFNNQPFILFFDLTQKENKNREDAIHKQVWCFDKAPIAFFILENEIKIYPNPVRDELTIIFESFVDEYQLQIVDLSGKEVYYSEFRDQRAIVDISEIQDGLYFLRIENDKKETFFKKIIKTK